MPTAKSLAETRPKWGRRFRSRYRLFLRDFLDRHDAVHVFGGERNLVAGLYGIELEPVLDLVLRRSGRVGRAYRAAQFDTDFSACLVDSRDFSLEGLLRVGGAN